MILGSSTENPSGSGPVGIRIRDCLLAARESHLALVSELASLEALAGAGDTGDTTGITTEFFSTTILTSPTAEFSSIAITSIAPVDFMAVDSTAMDFMTSTLPEAEVSRHRATASQVLMPRVALILELSADSIMEECLEASLPAGSRVSVEAFTAEEVFMGAEVPTEVAAGAANGLRHRKAQFRYGE